MSTLAETLKLATQYQRAQAFDQAAQVYQSLLARQPNQPEALHGLALLSLQQGQLEKAEADLNQLLTIHPHFAQAWLSLGNLKQAQGEAVEAERCYRKVLDWQPQSAVAMNNLGYSLQQQGRLDEALTQYQNALALQPNFREAKANLGNGLQAQGVLSAEQAQDYAQLNLDLGLERFQGQDLKTATAYFRQAIALQPQLWQAHNQLGRVLQRQGQWQAAIAAYQTALAIHPEAGDIYLQLGQLYQSQHQLQAAIAAYRHGLKRLNPVYARAIDWAQGPALAPSPLTTPPLEAGEVQIGQVAFPAVAPVADSDGLRPFWSVIITVYNRTDYLLECLASVLAQWPGPDRMEILVMDDASASPEIAELVNGLGQGLIRYYRNEHNLGLPGNWNAGVRLSRGQWVHLLHDDDYILPGFYARLEPNLQNCSKQIGAAFTGYENINEAGTVVFSQQLYGQQAGVAQDFLFNIGIANPLNMPAVVIRRQTYEKLGAYHPELTYTSDWELYKRIASFYDWWYEPAIGAHYRQHGQSKTNELIMSGTQVTSIRQAIEFSETYLPAPYREEITQKSRAYYFEHCLGHVAIPLKAQNLDAAWKMLEETLHIDASKEALAKLFSWLTRPEAAALRNEIASRLISLALSE